MSEFNSITLANPDGTKTDYPCEDSVARGRLDTLEQDTIPNLNTMTAAYDEDTQTITFTGNGVVQPDISNRAGTIALNAVPLALTGSLIGQRTRTYTLQAGNGNISDTIAYSVLNTTKADIVTGTAIVKIAISDSTATGGNIARLMCGYTANDAGLIVSFNNNGTSAVTFTYTISIIS